MVDRFPHMNDTDFPGLPGETAFLNNNFDYSKYDKTQMRIGICSVPWDVGLIHVGNAQIGGLGNVVYFETPEARDEYLDSIEDKYVWETEYREYHDDMFIQVPLPYEKAVRYNYIWVEYTRLPVDYSEGGKERFFFFIRECSQLAPSTCKVKILRDTWQTFIHDVNISYFMLEQGHAPMTLISADEYLANPIDNNSWLLSEDVNFGDSYKRKYHSSIVLNGSDMWCVFVTTSNPLAEFGEAHTDYWDTPNGHSIKDGQPTYYAFAIEPDDLSTFLDNIDSEIPQFAQTVQGVFFIAKNLVSTDGTFTFASIDCATLVKRQRDIDLAELTKDAFGFGEDYRELAKLYTYPYSFLEIADDSGNVSQIKIEETSGNLSLKVTTSLAYPWIAIDGRLSGVGEGSAALEFFNIDRHSFDIYGNWYDHIYNWNIPTFGITQSAAVAADYQTYFDRKQKALELQTGLDNALNSANTSYDNAIASLETEKTNADASANTVYDDAVSRATTAKTNADARDTTTYDNAIRSAGTAKANADASDLTQKTNADASADTAKTNADNAADTAKTNADNAADTAKTNADNSALTTQTNADNMAEANRDNAYAANATEYTDREQRAAANKTNINNMNTCISDNAGDVRGTSTVHAVNARTYADKKLDALDIKIDGDLYADHAMAAVQAALTADLNIATMVMNQSADAIANVGNGAMNGAIAGAAAGGVGALGGAALGAASAAIGSAATASLAATSYALTVTNSQEQLNAELANMLSKARIQKAYNRAITDIEHNVNDIRIENDNTLNSVTTDRSVTASNAAAQLDYDTEKANAERDKGTNNDNALRSYNAIVAADLASYTTATTNSANEKSTANTNAANTQSTTKTNATNTQSTAKANAQRTYNTDTANNTRTQDTAANNALDTKTTELAANERDYNTAVGIAARDKATNLANNERTYDTGSDNAQRTLNTAEENAQRSYDAGIAGIQARLDQAALEAPKQYGTFADGETSVTRPQGLFCNIVTQSKDAIEQTGDHWLRFGYRCNRAWKFDTFNLMKHFTYWKAADLWISGNNVPDAYLDEIRFYLMGGVCVWKNPDDIGRISVYDNL